MGRLTTWQLGSFDAPFFTPTFGASGRISFSDTALGYLVPLIDDRIDTDADVTYPLVFSIYATAACRVRARSVAGSPGTAAVIAALLASGASLIVAGTDKVANYSAAAALLAGGVGGVFDTTGAISYGVVIPEGVVMPFVVRSKADCWLQVRPYDGTGTGTSGELVYACVSDSGLVGQ